MLPCAAVRRSNPEAGRSHFPRSFSASASIHLLVLGTGAAWGLLAAGREVAEVRTWAVALEPAFEPALESASGEDLAPVLTDELPEPELVESLDWTRVEPSEFEPWEEDLRPVDLGPPRFDLADLRLAPGPSLRQECDPPTPAGEPSADPAPEARAPSILEVAAIESPAPAYPRLSVQAGEEGSVLCRIHVSELGEVLSVEILESSGFERLDRAAALALSRWRFRPRREDGKAVPSAIRHRVTFRLNRS